MEIWKNYIYNYEVSNLGRIRNKVTGNILKHHINKNGHCICVVSCGGRNKKTCIRVHVAVAKLFIENPDNLPEVNHIDGNKQNNAVSNLEWCSSMENTRHAVKNGLRVVAKHEHCATAKLTSENVEYIRKVCVPKSKEYGFRALGRKFGVYHTTIEDIVKNNSWT